MIKFSIDELAQMALMLWRSEGVTLDDIASIGRDVFVEAYALSRDELAWTGPCVPPTDDEIGAMYDRALMLWASELMPTTAVH